MKKLFVVLIPLLLGTISQALNRSKQADTMQNREINKHIQFWAGQFKEHAEFCSDFTPDPLLKAQGLKIAKQFKEFVRNSNDNPDRAEKFLQLSRNQKAYQDQVYSSIKKAPLKNENGKLDKKIKLDLVDHMNKENAYAQDKARGKKYTATQEAKFWSEEHEGQAKTMASLMTPKAGKLETEAKDVASSLKLNKWVGTENTIKQANQELDKIGDALAADHEKSKVPAMLAEHEKRERNYAKEIFQRLDQAK